MEDYILRIYRRKEENGGIFGVVEKVGTEGKRAFRSVGELVRLLGLKGETLDEPRDEERIRLSIPATVEGRDVSGQPFSEDTVIEDLIPHGARFRLKARISEGDELQLLTDPACSGRRRSARIARVAKGPEPPIVEVVFR